MAERIPISTPEDLQAVDELQLAQAIILDEAWAGHPNPNSKVAIDRIKDDIRRAAIADPEYYRVLRSEIARSELRSATAAMTPDPEGITDPNDKRAAIAERRLRERADARTREAFKDILEPAPPTDFPRPAADQSRIPRNYDTMGVIDAAVAATMSPTEQAVLAARARVDQLTAERDAGGRRFKSWDKVTPMTGRQAVAANDELWNAQDRQDELQSDTPGYPTHAERRVAELEEVHRHRSSDEVVTALLAEARSRRNTLQGRRDAAMEKYRADLHGAEGVHHHLQERIDVHTGHAEETDQDYAKAAATHDRAQAELEAAAIKYMYDPGNSALAKAQDKLQRARDALDIATTNRNQNREVLDTHRAILDSLPGQVSREKIERELGTLAGHEDTLNNAISALLESRPGDNNNQRHGLLCAKYLMLGYIDGLDSRLAEMKPEHMNYAEVRKMRDQAMRSWNRSTLAASHIENYQAVGQPGDGFEGGYPAYHMRDGSGMLIERSNGRMVIYADGSFARFGNMSDTGFQDNKLGPRINPDGSYWKPNQPMDPDLYGNYNTEVEDARRYLAMDDNRKAHVRAGLGLEGLNNLERDTFEAWLFNQENPKVAAIAVAMIEDVRQRNLMEMAHTDPATRLSLIAENNALDYDARTINYLSRSNEGGNKGDYLSHHGVFVHKAEHYGHKGNWLAYPDGTLVAFTFDSNERIVPQTRFTPEGQRVAA